MRYKKYTRRNLARRSLLDNLSITVWLIIINVFVFIVSLFFQNYLSYFALQTSSILKGQALWTIFTSMFFHANFLHLFVNMFSLFFIGSFAEKIVGRKRFLGFYLISGIVGSLFFVFFSGAFGSSVLGARLFGSPDIYALGASGAIFGIVGLIAVIIPYQKVFLILGPLIVIIIDALLPPSLGVVSIILNLLILVMIFSMFSFNPRLRKIAIPVEMPMWILPIAAIVPLFIIGFFVSLPIGNTAHLGGLVAGLAYGLYLKSKYQKKIALLNRYIVK